MNIVFALLYLVLLLFQWAIIIRIVFELVQSFARSWRPKGPALVTASVVYGVTDPVVRPLRRLIKPVQLGGIALDVSILVIFAALWVGMIITKSLA